MAIYITKLGYQSEIAVADANVLDLKIDTTSGTLQDQIDALDLNYATDAQLASVSGALNLAKEDAIGVKGTAFNKSFGTISGTIPQGDHTHDARYYTEGEVDVISGSINGAKADAIHTHDDIYYREIEVDVTASGTTKYFGSNDWRITVSGVNLSIDKWDGANWVAKTTISGA